MKWCLSLSGFGSPRQSPRRPAARDGEGLLSRVPVQMSPHRDGTGMRILGRGLLVVDEARPVNFNGFFSCVASYLSCPKTCATTVQLSCRKFGTADGFTFEGFGVGVELGVLMFLIMSQISMV